ncbi:hypothetical protein BGZ80_002501 [Entomortierella chlamydospora]|uniref:Adhesin domain-containing protein n=1 Tax=Entomortierella chlamydospora TaxID=101097 RepID=A0A9P6N194_9FUNG|nr:hypothetical protein BGZ80_002501 [Entomortierella chlamydospora]
MGLFSKPLLSAHFENEDVQISAELCPNISVKVVGRAKGDITILSGNEDMVQIHTSVQAKEVLIKNAAALEPIQDGDQYTYTIHTPLEEKLEKAVTFQVFITIPRHLDSLESFKIEGHHIEVAVGNIGHTFIRKLEIANIKGDISIDNFYGECATISSAQEGGIKGKFSVARLNTSTKSGRIISSAHLLNTDDQQPPPKVICQAMNHCIDLKVDGTDLFGPFSVEAKTQVAPLDVKILLSSEDQRFLGNFINFGGVSRVLLSDNYQGRIETRTHYGKIFIDEPRFVRLKDAMLSVPSKSDRDYYNHLAGDPMAAPTPGSSSLLSSMSHISNKITSKGSSQGTTMSLSDDHPSHHRRHPSTRSQNRQPSSPGSINSSGSNSRAESTTGSYLDNMSPPASPVSPGSDRQKWIEDKDKDSIITRELIGTVGEGPGLVICKNSSEDIFVKLI